MATFLTAAKFVLRTIFRFLRDADVFLLVICLISSVYGIILISSVTASFQGGSGGFIRTQLSALMLGTAAFIFFSYIDIDIIAERPWVLYTLSMLFIATLYFWGEGQEETGNRAWLRFWGFGIQPAEVVKISFTIIIARMLVDYKEKRTINAVVSMFRIMFIFGSIFGLIIIVSSDLGSALIFAFILVMMMYAGGIKIRWFAAGAVLIAAASPFLFNQLADYQQRRILAPFQPDVWDPTRQGVLWQANQSVRALTSGGFTGQGLGRGELTQTDIIPFQQTDFIFSAAGEELGFIGVIGIIVLLTIVIVRCFYVGIKSNNPLGMLVCIGVASMFAIQTLENVGMCLGILPVVGITLPFFSYGGSSLVTCFTAAGLVSGVKMNPRPVSFKRY